MADNHMAINKRDTAFYALVARAGPPGMRCKGMLGMSLIRVVRVGWSS